MGFVRPLDILADVSYALLETYVDTKLNVAILAPGLATVFPSSVNGIYVGTLLVIGYGTANEEIVTVTAVSPISPINPTASFSAVFTKTHPSTETVNGATFSSGLFTQTEMLKYLQEAENSFLIKVRPMFFFANQQGILAGTRFYPQPPYAVRIERISISGKALMNTSQLSLDMDNPSWESDHSSDIPKAWFQDEIGLDQFGIWPLVDVGAMVAIIWYSMKDANTGLVFTDNFILSDIFTMYLKYGVLARAFSKDGEQRDDLRAKFCQKRFDFGVMLARMFLFASETLVEEMQTDQEQMQRFSPMMISGGK